MRVCTACEVEKPLDNFSRLYRGKLGYRSQCKACDKAYRENNQKLKVPNDNEKYEVNAITMTNHFYLHFGFSERRYNESEWYDSKKYNIEPIATIKTNKR